MTLSANGCSQIRWAANEQKSQWGWSLNRYLADSTGAQLSTAPSAALLGHSDIVRSVLHLSVSETESAGSAGEVCWTGGEDGRLCRWEMGASAALQAASGEAGIEAGMTPLPFSTAISTLPDDGAWQKDSMQVDSQQQQHHQHGQQRETENLQGAQRDKVHGRKSSRRTPY